MLSILAAILAVMPIAPTNYVLSPRTVPGVVRVPLLLSPGYYRVGVIGNGFPVRIVTDPDTDVLTAGLEVEQGQTPIMFMADGHIRNTSAAQDACVSVVPACGTWGKIDLTAVASLARGRGDGRPVYLSVLGNVTPARAAITYAGVEMTVPLGQSPAPFPLGDNAMARVIGCATGRIVFSADRVKGDSVPINETGPNTFIPARGPGLYYVTAWAQTPLLNQAVVIMEGRQYTLQAGQRLPVFLASQVQFALGAGAGRGVVIVE